MAVAVEHPLPGQFAAFFSESAGQAVGGDGHRHVDHDRVAGGRPRCRYRVGRVDALSASAVRHHATGFRAGGEQHHHHAFIGDALEIRREAGDVLAAADRHAAGTEFFCAFQREIDRARSKPGTGQAHAVPGHRSRKICNHAWRTGFRHAAFFQFVQIRRQQMQAVRVVAEQIAFDKYPGDDFGFCRFQPGLSQQRGGEAHEVFGAVTWLIGH